MPLLGLDEYRNAVSGFIEANNDEVFTIYVQGLTNIAVGTPVDEGFARNNWNLTTSAPSVKYIDVASDTGAKSLAMINKMPSYVLDKTIYYTNNSPYINKLEYGGYPNPTDGTPVKGGGFDKHTANGFSDQAPNGWVRTELLEIRKALRAIK